ncbi:unnamed protein product, partial [Linum tenue]
MGYRFVDDDSGVGVEASTAGDCNYPPATRGHRERRRRNSSSSSEGKGREIFVVCILKKEKGILRRKKLGSGREEKSSFRSWGGRRRTTAAEEVLPLQEPKGSFFIEKWQLGEQVSTVAGLARP